MSLGHQQNTPAKRVCIQKVTDAVLEVYEKLKRSTRREETKLSVIVARKVRQEGLIEILENFRGRAYSQVMKDEAQVMISSIKYMVPGGDAKMFICHNHVNDESKLEFACVVTRKYMYHGMEVTDYLVTTYSYQQEVNTEGLVVGATATGIGFGALVLGFATGGIGFMIAAPIYGLLGITTMAASSDTTINSGLKDIIEASFVYELVERGHTEIENGKLYLKAGDDD